MCQRCGLSYQYVRWQTGGGKLVLDAVHWQQPVLLEHRNVTVRSGVPHLQLVRKLVYSLHHLLACYMYTKRGS